MKVPQHFSFVRTHFKNILLLITKAGEIQKKSLQNFKNTKLMFIFLKNKNKPTSSQCSLWGGGILYNKTNILHVLIMLQQVFQFPSSNIFMNSYLKIYKAI